MTQDKSTTIICHQCGKPSEFILCPKCHWKLKSNEITGKEKEAMEEAYQTYLRKKIKK